MKAAFVIIFVMMSGLACLRNAAAMDCQWFDAAELMPEIQSGAMISRCVGVPLPSTQKIEIYSVHQKPTKGAVGLCEFRSSWIFQSPTTGKWSYRPEGKSDYKPRHSWLMAEPEGNACLPQSDPRYIAVQGASEGVVKLILQRWREITASYPAFVEFFGGEAAGEFQRNALLHEMKERIKNGQKPQIEISRIELEQNVGFGSDYEVGFRSLDDKDRLIGWGIVVDLTETGLTLVAFSMGMP